MSRDRKSLIHIHANNTPWELQLCSAANINVTVNMRRLGSVQQKIPCVFLTEVKQEPSRKRDCQQFQVVATEHVNPVSLEANVDCALATEKLDGTCCYVTVYKGRPHLWARLDRKPTKQAEKRFRKHQRSHRSCKGFTWNVEEDFKAVPEAWIPAHRVKHHSGRPVPDEHGHIPGWVPVEKHNKQYCWHSSVLDRDVVAALVLRPSGDDEDGLEVAAVPLADLLEQTLELIGTNVNGNPYVVSSQHSGVRSSRCTAWCHTGVFGSGTLRRWTSSSCAPGSRRARRAGWRASCGTAATARSLKFIVITWRSGGRMEKRASVSGRWSSAWAGRRMNTAAARTCSHPSPD
ncbi:RNA ligase 1 isoform X2 [Cottoperca gobio]|uniref:RNA ligase 1 n=1 Tax=Cottoperca gobio TaxID=56716 RepID=A0A6J2PY09_COTGO|nr:uncharacterized protein C12orf29 homolog isoform X2 [Cottoperca gobio]